MTAAFEAHRQKMLDHHCDGEGSFRNTDESATAPTSLITEVGKLCQREVQCRQRQENGPHRRSQRCTPILQHLPVRSRSISSNRTNTTEANKVM